MRVVPLLVALSACCPAGARPAGGHGADGGRVAAIGDAGPAEGSGDGGPGCQGTLTVSPASATLTVTDGAKATQQFAALVTRCGAPSTVPATWSLDRTDLATIGSSTGLATALGPRGGLATVTATVGGATARAQLRIVVVQTIFSGAPTTAPGDFGGTQVQGGSGAPSILYPNDQVILPVNLQPLDFQWRAGTGNALYRLTLTGPFAVLIAYVVPPNAAEPAWQPAVTPWGNFAQSNVGKTVTLDLAGTSGAASATVYDAPEQTLTLAASRFAGTIYYWAVNVGQILRVSAGSAAPQPFYTAPRGPSGNTCIGCHAVSPDGTRLSAELWGGGSPGTVVDLASSPATPLVSVGPAWDFSTFDSTGKLLVVSNGGDLTLRDSQTAQPVPAGTGEGNLSSLGCGLGSTCTQPAWSRDGQLLLFIKGLPQAFGSDWSFNQADLLLSRWAAGTQTFSAPTLLVAHDFDGQPWANVYPTVSVDDALVAFTRSPCSYGSQCLTSAKLMLLPAGGGAPLELARAEGGDTTNRFPNFSPFKEGGFHWMAFFSLRNYGWVTSAERQIWVTAVDDDGAPTADPSHPAFWLPGQDSTTQNDKAEWAKLPCVGSGQACEGDIDCCSGLACRGSKCIPAGNACGLSGAACASSSDCCAGLSCAALTVGQGTCRVPCEAEGGLCAQTRDCCAGLSCQANGQCAIGH